MSKWLTPMSRTLKGRTLTIRHETLPLQRYVNISTSHTLGLKIACLVSWGTPHCPSILLCLAVPNGNFRPFLIAREECWKRRHGVVALGARIPPFALRVLDPHNAALGARYLWTEARGGDGGESCLQMPEWIDSTRACG